MSKIVVPYTSAKQFLEDGQKHGMYIKMSIGYHLPTTAYKMYFETPKASYLYRDICSPNYSWLDGSPCGVVIDETGKCI